MCKKEYRRKCPYEWFGPALNACVQPNVMHPEFNTVDFGLIFGAKQKGFSNLILQRELDKVCTASSKIHRNCGLPIFTSHEANEKKMTHISFFFLSSY